eukprot:NODE_9350_length_1430_cov_6.739831.p1 GENE.NODE_9350_length_1430_cov_6.739831~~NODE_9350_length_1430_cov_6.739831.p1  ORF type:complete len:293 (+),score=58.47 NODE_9350_length_1430_cov_6.739831:261-1139(+)
MGQRPIRQCCAEGGGPSLHDEWDQGEMEHLMERAVEGACPVDQAMQLNFDSDGSDNEDYSLGCCATRHNATQQQQQIDLVPFATTAVLNGMAAPLTSAIEVARKAVVSEDGRPIGIDDMLDKCEDALRQRLRAAPAPQRQSKTWQELLDGADAARHIMLVLPGPQPKRWSESSRKYYDKVPSMLKVSTDRTQLSILPDIFSDVRPMTIQLEKVLDILVPTQPAVGIMQVGGEPAEIMLEGSDIDLAVLIEYMADDSEVRRICFLEDTKVSKDCCVRALLTFWFSLLRVVVKT